MTYANNRPSTTRSMRVVTARILATPTRREISIPSPNKAHSARANPVISSRYNRIGARFHTSRLPGRTSATKWAPRITRMPQWNGTDPQNNRRLPKSWEERDET